MVTFLSDMASCLSIMFLWIFVMSSFGVMIIAVYKCMNIKYMKKQKRRQLIKDKKKEKRQLILNRKIREAFIRMNGREKMSQEKKEVILVKVVEYLKDQRGVRLDVSANSITKEIALEIVFDYLKKMNNFKDEDFSVLNDILKTIGISENDRSEFCVSFLEES